MNDIVKKDFVDGMIDKVKGNGIGIRVETKEFNVSVWDTSKGPVTNWESYKEIRNNQESSSKEKTIELVKDEEKKY